MANIRDIYSNAIDSANRLKSGVYGNSVSNNNANNSSSKSAYQTNLAQPAQTQPQNFSTRFIMGQIATLSMTDKPLAQSYYQKLQNSMSDPNSDYYNPYNQPTNRAVSNLTALGFDTANLNDNWFNANQGWISSNLSYTGTTNSPSKPGKKATRDQQIAYELYQWHKSEDTTKKAEQQWQALQEELSYWAKNNTRNYSDDYIIDHIDWSKYSELAKMDEDKYLQPTELNRAIGYSKDAMYGVLWAARNDYDGDIWGAMANSALGTGKQYVEDPEIAAKLNWSDKNTYSPYSVGMTLKDEGVYFDVDNFGEEEISRLKNGQDPRTGEALNPNDATAMKMLDNVLKADNTTVKAEAELEDLNKRITSMIDSNNSEKNILDQIERMLDDCPTLRSMDTSLEGSEDGLLKTTRKIDYKHDDLINDVRRRIAERDGRETGAEYTNNLVNKQAAPAQTGIAASPVDVGSGSAGIPSYDMSSSAGTAGANGEPVNPAGVATGAANNPAGTGEGTSGIPSYDMTTNSGAVGVNGKPLKTPTDLVPGAAGAPALTQSDIQTIKAQDVAVADAVSSMQNDLTDGESVYFQNAPSTGWDFMKDAFSYIRNNVEKVRGIAQDNYNASLKTYVEDNLDAAFAVGQYNTVMDSLGEDNDRLLAYRKKYGDLENYYSEVKDNDDVFLDDLDAQVEFEFNHETNKYEVIGITDQANGGMIYYPDTSYAENSRGAELVKKAEVIAEEKTKKAREILNAQLLMRYYPELRTDIEAYGALNAQVEKEKAYIKEHDLEYEEQNKAMASARAGLDRIFAVGMVLGVGNASDREEADALISVLSEYYNQPDLPSSELTPLQVINNTAEAFGTMQTREEKSQKIHESMDSIDEAISFDEQLLDYIDRNGIKVPDNIRRNIQYELEDYRNERQAFAYASILTDVPQDELDKAINAGLEFEEKYGSQMEAWDEIFKDETTAIDQYKTLGGKLRYMEADFVDEDDKKIYYYLLGQSVLSNGAELEATIENNDTYGIRDILDEKILKAGNDFIAFMDDDDYGVWTSRNKKEVAEYSKEMVDSGFAGGVAANVASTFATPLESILSGVYMLDRAVSGKRINPDTKYRIPSVMKDATREETRASIQAKYENEPVKLWLANLGYEIYCNRGDSMMNQLTLGSLLGGSGMLGEFKGSMPMGISAALNAAAEAVENGADVDQAWLIAGATFLAETATEAVTYGNIKEALGTAEELSEDTVKAFLYDWLVKSGPEELTGEVLNNVVERAASQWAARMKNREGYESDHQRLVDRYVAQGKEEDAEILASMDELKDDIHTAVVSYLSAGTDVFVKTGKAAVNGLNYYRSATRSDQQLGGSRSMVQNMLNGMQQENAAQQTNRPIAVGKPAGTAAQQATAQSVAQNAAQANVQQETVNVNPDVVVSEETEFSDLEKEYAQDIETIDSAINSADSSAISAGIAVAIGFDASDAGSDMANAAAVRAVNVFDNGAEGVSDILYGGFLSKVNAVALKSGIQYAALGGENSVCYNLTQTEEFKNATPEQKAVALARASVSDAVNPAVQQNVSSMVQENRLAEAMKTVIARGSMEGTVKAEGDLSDAEARNRQAKKDLQVRQGEVQAASDIRENADLDAINDPLNDSKVKEAQQARNKLESAVAVEQEYEQSAENAQKEQEKAEANLESIRQKEITETRQQANAVVEDQNRQRAERDAQIAEQNRIAEEQAAQAQAEEDERTGKAEEDRRNTIIEGIADSEGLQGEERDNRIDELAEQAEKVKIRIKDLNQPVSNTEGALAVYAFGRKLGIDIEMADLGPVNGNSITRGMYKDGKIYLNSNLIKSGKMSVGQALVEASLHEIVHSMENTKSYQNFRNVVMESVFGANNGADAMALYNENNGFRAKVDALIQERIEAGDQNFVGKDLTEQVAAAEKEIVADFARMNLAEKDVVQRFMDAGMGGKMRNTLHNINQALKNYFGGLTGEERKTAEYLRRAERAFQKAMVEAAKTDVHPESSQFSITQFAQAAGLEFDQNSLTLYDPNGNVIDGVNNKVTADMMDNTPVGLLIDLARDGSKAKNGNVKFAPTISAETAQAQKQMFADLMNMVAQYKDSNLVWEIASSTMFSALKSNSDPQYSTTVDFGTVCAKTQEIINVMSQVMLEKGRGLTREEVLKVYNETANAGLTVPCPVCYVFSRWMGVPSLLNQMSQYQERFVKTNEDGTIDMEATAKEANDYIKAALEKYGSKDKIDDAKVSIINRMKTQENNRTNALAVLNSETATEAEKAKAQTKHDEAIKNLDNLQKDLAEVEAYNWVTQALCLQKQKGKTKYNVLDKDGNYVIDPNFELTPNDVLFDLRRTGEFAKYTKNWTYRNTRGAGMGKAIMPYSGESIGDIIFGTTRKSDIQNPFLTQVYTKAADGIKNAVNRARQQNLIGGQRLQSTSDFRPEWGLDYMMAFLELQAVGSKVQMYTKVAEAVDLLASMGADVNLSIMGKGQGWHTDENGNQVLDFSDVTGMDYDTARELKNKYDNVQMILVGMNDTHIKLALANPDIDFVIPWHSSGNSKDTLSSLISSVGESLEASSDYTDTQSDKESENQTEDQKNLWNLRMKILQGKKLNESELNTVLDDPYLGPMYKRFTEKGVDDDCYQVKLGKDQAKQIFPYEYWNKELTKDQANANGQAFIDYCNHFGIVPRFSGVVKHNDDGSFSVTGNFAGAVYDENGNITGYDPEKMYDGYWKVLIDRPMYDNSGNYRDQQVVDVTKAKIGALENGQLTGSDMPLKTSAMYGPNYSEQEKTAVDNSLAAIEEQAGINGGQKSVLGDLTEADQDLMSNANTDYMDAVSRGDMEAAQEDVDFYAEQAGYTEKAYHGADVFGFTEFDLEAGQGTIFVAYDKDLAATYSNADDVKPIYNSNLDTADNETLVELFKGANERMDSGLSNVAVNQNGDFIAEYEDGETETYSREEIIDGLKTFDENYSAESFDFNAETYVADTLHKGIYGLYTRPGNQLVIDGEGKPFGETRVPWSDKPQSTREIAEYAKENGYDSVRINNIIDRGHHFNKMQREGRDIGIFFRENDVKSSDLITKDNNGNVIPLNERFTNSNDIRYSTEGDLTEADRDLMSGSVSGMLGGSVGYTAQNGQIRFDNAPSDLVRENLKTIGMIYDESTHTWSDSGRRKLTLETIVKAVEDGNKGIKATPPPRATANKQKNVQQQQQKDQKALEDLRKQLKDKELNQTLVNAGVITPEELAAYQEREASKPLEGQNPTMSTAQGTKIRAFAAEDGMLQDADQVDRFAQAVVTAQNTYFPDTNEDQVIRAVKWIRSLKQTENSDGYAEAVQAITSDDFDYRSADGQARMVAAMALANARGDVLGQTALADAFMRQGTDLGRALQARKLFKLMTPEGRISTLMKTLNDYNADLKQKGMKGDLKFSDWILQAAAFADTAEDFRKVQAAAAAELAEKLPISWKERLNAFRMLSMLGNPRTHIRNIIGNALFVPAVGLKNKIGAVLELGVKKGERTKTLAPVLNSEIREFARQDARAIRDELTGEAKYDEHGLVEKAKNPLGPVFGWLSDVNSNFLEGEDWLFLRGHYRRALGSWMQVNGYTVEQVKNDKKLLEKGREYAVNEAKKATYRDFNGVAQWLNQHTRNPKTPGQKALAFGVNAVLPFRKTPANILKRGIEYSPLGVARSVYNLGRMFVKGDVSATSVIDQFASGLAGTSVMALGFLLAGTGAVSCGFDDDDWPEELKGTQKYSINPGKAGNAIANLFGIPKLFGEDVTYTLDWAAPMSMPLFVGAAIRNQADEEGWDYNKVLDAIGSISEPVFNLSMLDGVNSLLKVNSYSNENPFTQIGAKIVSNYATSYVPSVLGAITRTFFDDTQRKSFVTKGQNTGIEGTFRYAWESAENKIPGVSKTNIPVRDVWGKEKTSEFAERLIENFISPGYIEHYEDDPVVNELGRLFDSTGSPALEPEHATTSVKIDKTTYNLGPQEYDTFDRVHGETQYSMLKELVNNEAYQNLTDDDAKVEIISKIYSYANSVAKNALFPVYKYEKMNIEDLVHDGVVTSYKSKMMKCLEDEDYEDFFNYVGALREENVEDSAIREKISGTYRDQWKEAYRMYLNTGDQQYSDQMAKIENILNSTGFEFKIYTKGGWMDKVNEEYSNR